MHLLPWILLVGAAALVLLPFIREPNSRTGASLLTMATRVLRPSPAAMLARAALPTHALPALVVYQALYVAPVTPVGGWLILEAAACLFGALITVGVTLIALPMFGYHGRPGTFRPYPFVAAAIQLGAVVLAVLVAIWPRLLAG